MSRTVLCMTTVIVCSMMTLIYDLGFGLTIIILRFWVSGL